MERLVDVIPYLEEAEPPTDSKQLLLAGLFADTLAKLKKASIGLFNPGNVGGTRSRPQSRCPLLITSRFLSDIAMSLRLG